MNEWLPVLILTSLFFVILLVGIIVFVFHLKVWSAKRDEYYHNRMAELEGIFKKEITNLIESVKKII